MSHKFYTKNGDKGFSSVLGGAVLPKSAKVFTLLGSLDELNSVLGMCTDVPVAVSQVQRDLFEMGAVVAGSRVCSNVFWEERITWLEEGIDHYETKNIPLKNFILPGGHPAAANLFFARAVCRRVEREFVANLGKTERTLQSGIIKYLNRLSDLLFVLARYINLKNGVQEEVWK
jgi:cob(I)alamin adenosyltransferase